MEKLEVYSRTDKGKKRTINEDSLLVRQIGDVYLLAVADGLGGHAAGEVASKMALIELEEYFKAHLNAEPAKEIMQQAIDKANKEIYLLSEENPEYKGMGSTLVVALIYKDQALIANIGDSRAYLLTDEIKQITRDHSLVQEMVDKNVITKEDGRHDLQQNIVTRVLGTGIEVQADFFEPSLNCSILLFCSDGLPDALRDEQILEIVKNAPNLETACSRLIEKSNEEGGRDNVSVILAKDIRWRPKC
jgi:PPM family protein phosphatase